MTASFLGENLRKDLFHIGLLTQRKKALINPNSTKKVVFTKTLDRSEWDNTVLGKGDLVDEITKLKKQDGTDIIAYGGATFVSALIKQRLIDEFHLFINPTAIGNGMTIFKELDSKQNLTLVKSISFNCGIVVLNYEPKRD